MKKSTENLQSKVLRQVLAWHILLMGVIILGRGYFKDFVALKDSPSYLVALLVRSVDDVYQLFLLSGWLALFPHALLVIILYQDKGTHKAYDRFAVWAQALFTSLGFIGTIVGVSLAVSGLEGAMKSNEPSLLIEGLSTAFDTTFLGLGAAVSLMCLRKVLELRHI